MIKFKSESELAAHVVAWLKDQHWEVYQEVSIGYMDAVMDIVGIKGKIIWNVETKTSLSLSLLGQAIYNREYCHFVSIAHPRTHQSSRKGKLAARYLMRDYGIGEIEVEPGGFIIDTRPRMHRNCKRKFVLNSLNDAQKSSIAGSKGGGYWTPFKETCRKVVEIVKQNEGIYYKEMINKLDHHYRTDQTANSCLRNWIGTNKIPGIELYYENGKSLRLRKLANEKLGGLK